MLEKYGVDHNTKFLNWEENTKKRNLKKYGCEWPMQSQIIKNKAKQTKKEIYGNEYYTNPTKALKTKIKNNITQNKSYIPSIYSQNLFWKIYEQLENKEHIYFAKLNKEFGKYNSINNKYYFYDFVDTKNKKIIEFNGDYWHMNPNKFKSADIHPTSKLLAEEIWYKDQQKINFITSIGFKVLIIWEAEAKQNESIIINKCINFLK